MGHGGMVHVSHHSPSRDPPNQAISCSSYLEHALDHSGCVVSRNVGTRRTGVRIGGHSHVAGPQTRQALRQQERDRFVLPRARRRQRLGVTVIWNGMHIEQGELLGMVHRIKRYLHFHRRLGGSWGQSLGFERPHHRHTGLLSCLGPQLLRTPALSFKFASRRVAHGP